MNYSLRRLTAKKESEMRRAELEAYLLAEIRRGRHFFKSSDVAKATGFSAKRVGTNFALMQTYSDVLDIVRWSKSCSSSVWKITENQTSHHPATQINFRISDDNLRKNMPPERDESS